MHNDLLHDHFDPADPDRIDRVAVFDRPNDGSCCERCGDARRNPYHIGWDEDYEGFLCGKCSNDFWASVEQAHFDRLERIAEQQEY